MTRKLAGLALVCAALGFVLSSPTSSAQQNKDKPLQIGMAKTFFNDLPKAFINIGGQIFGQAMKGIVGIDGSLQSNDDAFEIAKKLDNGQYQLGVFHGHEFAWVQKKHPDLVPLVVAVNAHRDVKAYLIVNKDSPAKTIADLRGKKIGIPMGTKQQCIMYITKHCTDNNTPKLEQFFSTVARPSAQPAALDELANGDGDAVLMDTIGLEWYKQIKGPVFTNKLRVLHESDSFPPVVIVYKKGGLDDATLKKVYEGLLGAKGNPAADPVLQMWQIAAFEPIPESYSKSLADVLKAYPNPK